MWPDLAGGYSSHGEVRFRIVLGTPGCAWKLPRLAYPKRESGALCRCCFRTTRLEKADQDKEPSPAWGLLELLPGLLHPVEGNPHHPATGAAHSLPCRAPPVLLICALDSHQKPSCEAFPPKPSELKTAMEPSMLEPGWEWIGSQHLLICPC